MAMNFGKGAILAKVLNSKLKDDLLRVTDKLEDVKEHFEKYECKDKETIQQVPDKQKERSILYVTGASGSGKSYYTYLYCEQYRKMYPKNPIYLISSVNDDSSIDKIKGFLSQFVGTHKNDIIKYMERLKIFSKNGLDM